MSRRPFFYRLTEGIRVTVRPGYIPEQSRPGQHHFVFGYAVRIENVGPQPAQLIARRWRIHDSSGRETEIDGEGVVGEQPVLAPGQVHEYRSFCVLESPAGYMEGEYRFVRPDGTAFEAAIPRFELAVDEA